MLLRNKKPNQGLWNGVGGHIEIGESPHQSCLREIKEETGFTVSQINFRGILTWKNFEIEDGGLYLFTGDAPSGTPLSTSEGKLEWLSKKDVLTSPAVVENIHYFGPFIFSNSRPALYHFDYEFRKIIRHQCLPLPGEIDIFKPYPQLYE